MLFFVIFIFLFFGGDEIIVAIEAFKKLFYSSILQCSSKLATLNIIPTNLDYNSKNVDLDISINRISI